jgi:hypothetical protein
MVARVSLHGGYDGHVATALSDQPMTQPDGWRMIRRRAVAVGIMAPIGNHSGRPGSRLISPTAARLNATDGRPREPAHPQAL